MYDVILFKNTNFGNNDRVWNIPSPTHDFDQYTKKTYANVNKRFPLLATSFIVGGNYSDDLKEYDYMIVKDVNTNDLRYYFIDGITGDRNIIMLSVILDTFTTFNLLSKPITGTLIRKHDTNINETPFDYPTALQYNPMYETYRSEIVTVIGEGTKSFIESAVDLTSIPSASTIQSDLMKNVTVPVLKKPRNGTDYGIRVINDLNWVIWDTSNALKLYRPYSNILSNVDTLRALSGDGAISDSFTIPNPLIEVTESTTRLGDVTMVEGLRVQKETSLEYKQNAYIPVNKAIEGLFRVEISSMSSGDFKEFPSWAVKNSVSATNKFVTLLWCDPKPSGNPYCTTLHPPINIPMIQSVDEETTVKTKFDVMLKTSVKGSQWLRNPLIYNTGKGEIFASVETQLQRDKSAFEMNSAMTNLEISQREKDIRIAQQKYNYEASQTMGILGIAGDLLSGDLGGAISGVSNAMVNKANQQYIRELQSLKNYEGSKQGQLIKIAHSNNLRSLDIQEKIRRVVAPEVVHRESDSMKGYDFGNDFRVSIIQPDVETLRTKDMEYSLYGYPVAEYVNNFVMTNNLRVNHSVFQFAECLIEVGGDIGDITREFLRSGIRILSSKYSISNLINNPKKVI